jgi:hypothetical protein
MPYYFWVYVQAHDTTRSMAQVFRVGGVLQRKHADYSRVTLLVKII